MKLFERWFATPIDEEGEREDRLIVSRRKFLFLGAAAGAAHVLHLPAIVEAPEIAIINRLTFSDIYAHPPLSLYGIPYWETNAYSGTYLGIDRTANHRLLEKFFADARERAVRKGRRMAKRIERDLTL